MSPDVRAKKTVDCDVGTSKKGSIPADSGVFTHSQQSKITQHGNLTRGLEKIPTRHVLARKMPLYTFKDQDFSDRPLQYDIWCLVLDPIAKKHQFELLSECQERFDSGQLVYDDVDRGEGIHPNADQEWMYRLKCRKRWSKDVYKVKDIVRLRAENQEQVTVLLSPTEKERELLLEIRKQHGYMCNELVRIPLSKFPRSMQRKVRRDLKRENGSPGS